MRSMRRVITLCVVAAAAIAVTAPSASALEVVNEATGVHCGAVTQPLHGAATGGCPLRATGTGVELAGFFAAGVCTNTFEGRTNEAGVGSLYNASITNCVGTQFHACHEGATGQQIDPWPMRLTAENRMEASFCVHGPFDIAVNCHLDAIALTEVTSHRYRFSTIADEANGHQHCEDGANSVEGVWNQVVDAAHPAVEVRD